MISLLLLGLLATGTSGDALPERVSQYWDLLVVRDKASALEYVTSDSRNYFIERREPRMSSWRLIRVDSLSDSEATVEVEVMREIPGLEGLYPIEVVERWVRDDQWRVAIRPSTPADLVPASRPAADQLPKSLGFRPDQLKIPFLNPQQLGRVELYNGLSRQVEVAGVKFDEQRFEVVEAPAVLAPGERRRLTLRYRGDEVPKNLSSRLRVTLVDAEAGPTTLEIPILYNYFTDGARGLFGLTKEQADQIRRGDKLKPAISVPASGAAQEKPQQPEQGAAKPPAARKNGNSPALSFPSTGGVFLN